MRPDVSLDGYPDEVDVIYQALQERGSGPDAPLGGWDHVERDYVLDLDGGASVHDGKLRLCNPEHAYDGTEFYIEPSGFGGVITVYVPASHETAYVDSDIAMGADPHYAAIENVLADHGIDTDTTGL